MFIYKNGKKATCDISQLEAMKAGGWSTEPEPKKENSEQAPPDPKKDVKK